jgi:hypothetical protein
MKNGVYYSAKYHKIYIWHGPLMICDYKPARKPIKLQDRFMKKLKKKMKFIRLGDV